MSLVHFIAPEIQENPEGWGPCTIPDQFKDMPYQPFSKSDRIGKVCVPSVLFWCDMMFPLSHYRLPIGQDKHIPINDWRINTTLNSEAGVNMHIFRMMMKAHINW